MTMRCFRANWTYLKSLILVPTLVCAAIAPNIAAAGDAVDLYRGEADVSDRSAAELKRGASQAMRQVLVKLTGNRTASIARPDSAVVKNAADLILQYAYEQRGDGLVLNAQFDEPALISRLDSLNVAVWGKERPDTVVWLILDAGVSRQLISGDEPGLVGEAVQRQASRRGIPVLLPLMDIGESQHLTHAGDWDGLTATALALSSRYATPATLIGHLQQSVPGIWEAHWRLQVNQHQRDWEESGDILELLIENAIDATADSLAARYADPRQLAHAERIDVSIYGIRTAEDYARVANYLEGLDTVRDLFVSGVNNERLQVRFSARGGRQAVATSIGFGQVLAPVGDHGDAYQLIP